MRQRNETYRLLDGARGLTVLAVVLFHRGMLPWFPPAVAHLVWYGQRAGFLFFVISGYVIYQSAERHAARGVSGVWTFARKRFLRIYPAYLASLALSLVLAGLLFGSHVDALHLTALLTLTQEWAGNQTPNVVYWTLFFEQQFYVAMAILILPLWGRWRPWLVLATIPLALLRVTGHLYFHLANATLLAVWYYFLLGIVVYLLLHRRVPRLVAASALAVLIAGGLAAGGGVNGLRALSGLLFALFALVLYRFDGRLGASSLLRPVRFLGTISYSLYLIHLPVFWAIEAVCAHVGLHDPTISYGACVAASIGAAAAFYRVFERPFHAVRRAPLPSLPAPDAVPGIAR